MTRSGVLLSGGLDSAVLLAMEQRAGFEVWPIHVRAGLAWEPAEADAIARLLATPPFAGRTHPVTSLDVDMRDVYPDGHWAVLGQAPAYHQPDETVYLPGRNITLTAKAAVLACQLEIGRLALGPLAGNPFPDATAQFFDAMSHALSLGLAHQVRIVAPLSGLHKEDVVRMGVEMGVRLELTLSCMSPLGGGHCGRCNKCRERRDAFMASAVEDATHYGPPGVGPSVP
jgi:7-cyano-7-deazaguanine synthase